MRARRRHLQAGHDASRQMTVSWHTERDVHLPGVEWYTATGGGATTPARTRAVPGGGRYHHAALDGLPPATAVRYRPVAAGRPLAGWATFVTAPAGRTPVRFTAAGDQGRTPAAAALVRAVAAQRPAFHLHPGDLAYANDLGVPSGVVRQEAWEEWLDLIEPVAAEIPWMPAVGNHDLDPVVTADGDPSAGYAARFAPPPSTAAAHAYSFRSGCVGVVALDSHDVNHEFPEWAGGSVGAQTRWLAGELARMDADPRVSALVVFLHHGVYCSIPAHGSDGGVRAAWAHLFDRSGVDLVISGHNHGSERTHPVRDGRRAEGGTVYLTAGAGGQCPAVVPVAVPAGRAPVWTGPLQRDDEPAPWSAWTDDHNALTTVDVVPAAAGGAQLTVTTARLDGTVVDRCAWHVTRDAERRRTA